MLKPACDGAGHGIRICEYTTDEDAPRPAFVPGGRGDAWWRKCSSSTRS